ncbi:protein-methionine-sulfoxide reductase heme-binding subunit MsrQ [Marinobacterium arenosum]|uniref:sulfite oxidase heme-binding subunit YedZ n=1 Tax=Marinobacterium arenosum TaxID=2862496 RepID=UPI001C9371E2|nr:protein-methionine-sulfoxide reductase heme-binding subunit MsrQ [Marinobacterium arenosum]MBY4675504.1 sulfoxide reductase heme-binding subunit YedZ [Marinobacterium arenosum]
MVLTTAVRTMPWLRVLQWWLVFLAALLPLVSIGYDAWIFNLGADPAKEIVDHLGRWALYFLWITLAITPLRRLLHWGWLQRYRRMMGLYCLFYACLHLLAFATFIVGWRWDLLLTAFTERPYIFVGASALLLLIPLGITSTRGWQRRLKKNWLRLHRLAYPAALLVLVHVIWLIRSSYFDAVIYGVLLAWMLGYRLYLKRTS